jgi:hypothetical protein
MIVTAAALEKTSYTVYVTYSLEQEGGEVGGGEAGGFMFDFYPPLPAAFNWNSSKWPEQGFRV